MSLTSILKSSQFRDLKERLREDFPRPKIKLKGEIIAPPKTKNYGIIGTAFDYLLRFKLEREFKENTESREYWVADRAIESIRKSMVFKETKPEEIKSGDGKKISKKDRKNMAGFLSLVNRKRANSRTAFYQKVDNLYREAKLNYESFISTGTFTKELAKSSMVLAKLDLYVRAGILDDTISIYAEEDIQDLEKLYKIIPIKEFEPKKRIILNPTFGKGSSMFFGADADVILDNKLIDSKTTKNLKIDRSQINQLLCYTIASRIGGINENENLKDEIEVVGIYFSRYGQLWTIPLKEFGTNEKFKEFEKWIPNYFEEKFKFEK